MAFLFGCENVHLEYPTKVIFESLSLGVDDGDCVGVVGRNGDGKSSLLGLFDGTVEPDNGRVLRTGGVRFASLRQADELDDAKSIGWNVVGDTPEYEWASDARIRDIIDGMIGDLDWNAEVGTLSGGQRRRVDLARVLIADADVLLLDKPTNHLDVVAINWLAKHLKKRFSRGAGASTRYAFACGKCTMASPNHLRVAIPLIFSNGWSVSARPRWRNRKDRTLFAVNWHFFPVALGRVLASHVFMLKRHVPLLRKSLRFVTPQNLSARLFLDWGRSALM